MQQYEAGIEPARVKRRFGLDALATIGSASRDRRYRLKTPRAVNAAVYPEISILHIPTKFGDLQDAQRQISSEAINAPVYERARGKRIADGVNISDEVKDLVGRMSAGVYTRSITAATASAERPKTMYHEFGHLLNLIDKK